MIIKYYVFLVFVKYTGFDPLPNHLIRYKGPMSFYY